MAGSEFVPCELFASCRIAVKTVPVVKHDHRPHLQEIDNPLQHRHGGHVEVAVDVDDRGLGRQQAVLEILRQRGIVETLDRPEPIRGHAVSEHAVDKPPFREGQLALFPDWLLIYLRYLRQAFKGIEAHIGEVKEMLEMVPSFSHGVRFIATKLEVVPGDRTVDVQETRNAHKDETALVLPELPVLAADPAPLARHCPER